jgi:5'-deoxynucleotidase YfbR-like HD superfamily hydrolase
MNDVWMRTYTGARVHLLQPNPREIDILDIAHALSQTCRFAGHVPEFYSVAQHSVIVSDLLPGQFALWGLLHDASEAYLHDINRPLKRALKEYQDIENRMMAAICVRFGLPVEMPKLVKWADNVVLATEFRDLYQESYSNCMAWSGGLRPARLTIRPLAVEQARDLFLARFDKLYGERAA